MHKEAGERRVFLPEFVAAVAALGVEVLLEQGYGSELDLPADRYSQARFVGREECYAADLAMVLRSPERSEFELLRPGSLLFSMLHFPTRSWRVAELSRRGVGAIAMDQITDDDGHRLVENLSAVAWNGVEAAFALLERSLRGLEKPESSPIRTTILGTGQIGRIAVDAACKYGSVGRNNAMIASGHPGAFAVSIGRNMSGRPGAMRKELEATDILVDATQRRDASHPVVPNEWIAWLPEYAVIADLSVDPYLLTDNPPVVRGVEGIPRGDLDHYMFTAEDPLWDRTVPPQIPSVNRRAVASCYSWPGVHPSECMAHYGRQLLPLVAALVRTGYEELSLELGYYERAVYRGSLRYFAC